MSPEESLRRYNTTAISTELMRRFITVNRITSSIDCDRWFSLVPNSYKPAVIAVMPIIEEEFLGRHMTAESIDCFIYRLHQELCRELDRTDRDYSDMNLN